MGIFDIFTTDAQDKAATDQKNALGTANAAGQKDLQQGLDLATNSYASGVAPFLTNLQTTQPGQSAYGDATGANGAAGNARAVQNFQAGPGYNFALDQGNQNILRNQSATGQLASGKTNTDLATFGQGLANQQWQSYVQNLLPFVGASTANAGGVLTGDAALGNLQNQNKTNSANMDYGTNVGIGNANANADLASLTASGNIFNALMNGAGAAAGGSGGGSGGLGSFLSSFGVGGGGAKGIG